MTRVSASLRFRLIAGAAAIAMVAVFAALLAAYGAAETSRRIEQSVAAQRRMDLLSTLSARISDYAVMAVEASSAAAPAEVRAARLQSRASLVDDAFTRIDTALAEAVAEARREGETEQMRRATRSLVLARMRAQFQALTRRVVAAGPRPELRAALDSFATQFSPLLNEAIADERRDRDAAAAGVAGLRDRMIWLALGAGVIATVLVILFHLLLIRPLIDRLGRAAQAADEIGRGAFDVALPVALRDELGQLFEVINRMAARLKARRDDVDADRARLNELVSARTAELSEANERLSRIDAERRRFFADVGHELRTPLTVILAEAELGLKDGMEAADTQSALSVIRSRAVRLSRRIDDLLRVARSETGRIELNSYPFDLAEAAADAAADMAPLAKHRQMRLTCRLDPAPAIGDRDWCRQVVSGLIENAIRQSPAGAVIEIAAGAVDVGAADAGAVLTVTDEGKGLADGEAERVFERFARGAREATGSGFGVGLALARWVIERQSGSIALVSPAPLLAAKPAVAARRWCCAFRRPGPWTSRGPRRRQRMAEPSRRVLIVEDDDDIASALSRGLASEGYRPLIAHDASGAMELACGCDAAIVDVMLGEDRGEDLVRSLRAGGLDAPIIMLSALSGVDHRANGLAAGADDYVAKPFEFAELVARLRVQERRRATAGPARPGLSCLSYDPETRTVSGGGRSVALTEREGDLLVFLIENTGRVISRGEIFDALWLLEGGSSENVVDVYIGYLRRKLAPMSDFSAEIRTVRGRGFILTERTYG